MEPSTAVERHRLNLGCGTAIGPAGAGWVNLDMMPGPGVDVVHDLGKFPWPFEDNSFDVVAAVHILEHIPYGYTDYCGKQTDLFYAAMNEIYRILKPGGFLEVEVPTVGGEGAFQDQTHRRFFVPAVWAYVARPIQKVPNSESVRAGVKEGMALGVYCSVVKEIMGKSEDVVLDQRHVVERIFQELTKNAERAEDVAPHDWNWYHADYNILCRFDQLVNVVDGTARRYNFAIFRKPGVGE